MHITFLLAALFGLSAGQQTAYRLRLLNNDISSGLISLEMYERYAVGELVFLEIVSPLEKTFISRRKQFLSSLREKAEHIHPELLDELIMLVLTLATEIPSRIRDLPHTYVDDIGLGEFCDFFQESIRRLIFDHHPTFMSRDLAAPGIIFPGNLTRLLPNFFSFSVETQLVLIQRLVRESIILEPMSHVPDLYLELNDSDRAFSETVDEILAAEVDSLRLGVSKITLFSGSPSGTPLTVENWFSHVARELSSPALGLFEKNESDGRITVQSVESKDERFRAVGRLIALALATDNAFPLKVPVEYLLDSSPHAAIRLIQSGFREVAPYTVSKELLDRALGTGTEIDTINEL